MRSKQINSRILSILLFICLKFCGQSQNNYVDSLFHSLKKNNHYHYTVKREYFSKSIHPAFTHTYEVFLFKDSTEIYYKLKYFNKFESIKSKKFFGYNDLIDSCYKSMKSLFNYNKQIDSKHKNAFTFYTDSFIHDLRNFEKYIFRKKEYNNYLIFEQIDTNNFYSTDHSILYKEFKIKYFIDLPSYVISKVVFLPNTVRPDGEYRDSSILTFRYFPTTQEEVIKQIESFVPFKDTLSNSTSINYSINKSYFPKFKLVDTSNKQFLETQIKSKLTLVEFWYKSCGPCLSNMKNIEILRKQFTRTELEIICVNETDSINKELKQLIKKYNYSFKFLFGKSELTKTLGIQNYPTTIIFDSKSKKIIHSTIGTGPQYAEELSNYIIKSLN